MSSEGYLDRFAGRLERKKPEFGEYHYLCKIVAICSSAMKTHDEKEIEKKIKEMYFASGETGGKSLLEWIKENGIPGYEKEPFYESATAPACYAQKTLGKSESDE